MTQPRTPLGYSVGRWEGKTLVVERFTPAADGSRLDYTLDVTDPDSLAAPARFLRTLVWRPGEQMLPFECKE